MEAHHSHWAFYSFRETYDGDDYELGDRKLPWAYWKAQRGGRTFELDRTDNPIYAPISRRLKP